MRYGTFAEVLRVRSGLILEVKKEKKHVPPGRLCTFRNNYHVPPGRLRTFRTQIRDQVYTCLAWNT